MKGHNQIKNYASMKIDGNQIISIHTREVHM